MLSGKAGLPLRPLNGNNSRFSDARINVLTDPRQQHEDQKGPFTWEHTYGRKGSDDNDTPDHLASLSDEAIAKVAVGLTAQKNQILEQLEASGS